MFLAQQFSSVNSTQYKALRTTFTDFVDTVKIFESNLIEYYLTALTIDLFQADNTDSKTCEKVIRKALC